MATTNKKSAAGPATRGLKVTAKRESFWRAGFQFGFEPKSVALSEITREQKEAIEAEPMLLVQEVDMPEADAPKA